MSLQPIGEQDFNLAVVPDSTHLNITVIFRANAYLANANEYGFTLYVDGDPDFRRSLGITYPMGRQQFSDENLYTRLRPQSARLLYRTQSKAPLVFADVSLPMLEIQGIRVRTDETSSLLRIEYAIPLTSSRAFPYAVDAKGREILLGFEIKPPIREASSGMDPSQGGQDRMGMGTTRTPYGSINRDDELSQSMRRQMMGEYVKWVKIKL